MIDERLFRQRPPVYGPENPNPTTPDFSAPAYDFGPNPAPIRERLERSSGQPRSLMDQPPAREQLERSSGQPRFSMDQTRESMQTSPGQPRHDVPGYRPFEAHTQQTQDNQLMSHHMNSLLDVDSPLMRRAAQQGIDFAASRGLGNSSIAAGNAMGSMIDRAMPIAQFDASRFGSVADQNMNALNQVGMFNSQMTQQDRQFGQQMDLSRDQFDEAMRQFRMNFGEGQRQFDSTLLLNRDQFNEGIRQFGLTFDEGKRQFESTLGFNYDQLSQQQQQFLESIGLDRDKFAEAQRQFNASFGEGQRQFNASLAFQNQQLALQAHGMMMSTLAPIISTLNMNDDFMRLPAETQQAVMNNIVNNIFPGMSSSAWANIPPGILGSAGAWWGQHMPAFPPIFGPQQPPGTPPAGTSPTPPTGVNQPNGIQPWVQSLIDQAIADAIGQTSQP